ncbi:MAG: translocation/assembly module TamB domain-containing protein [Bacillota bacterium]|nr:translocation/assembly module TamB domain-containing protein [Bacillota bacterium]
MHISPRNPRVIAAVSALALVAALFFFIYTHLHAIQVAALAKAHDLVQSALEEGLGREVTVGAITSGGLDSVVLADVVVPAGPGEGAGDPVLAAKQVIVKYSLLDVVFRRKPVVETITSVTLVEAVARAGRAPDGRLWPYGLVDISRLAPSGGGVGGFMGSVSVRDGRLEVSGVPGIDEPVVVKGINGAISFTGAGLAWRASAHGGPKDELRLAVTGTFDAPQGAFACDATASGAVPADLLDIVRRILDERPDLVGRTGEGAGREVLAWLGAAGKAELGGGKVQVDIHVRPGQDGGRLVRGEVSLAETRLSVKDPAPGVESIQGVINLASEFQVDQAGFSCQGKGSASVGSAQCDGSAVGLGRFEADGRAVVDFWQRAGDDLCIEGRADLSTPGLSMSDAVRAALASAVGGAADSGTVKVEGPLHVSLAFAGRASKGVDVRGKVAMAGGQVLLQDIAPEIARLEGDVGWEVEFTRDAKGVFTYAGKVQTTRSSVETGLIADTGGFTGAVSATFTFSGATGSGPTPALTPALVPAPTATPGGGAESDPGEAGGAAGGPGPGAGSGGHGDGAGGRPAGVSIAMIPAFSGQVTILSGTVRMTRPAVGLTSARGAVTGSVSISGGGASAAAEYSGTLRFAGASLAMARPEAGLRSFETGASGSVEFDGRFPGKARFQGSVDLEDGNVSAEISGGGVKSASGEAHTRGKVLFAGEFPGRIEYRGTVDASRGRLAMREGPGGLDLWETQAEGHADFEGKYPGSVRYAGALKMGRGRLAVKNGPSGIASWETETGGRVDFEGVYPGAVQYRGAADISRGRLLVEDGPGGIVSWETETAGHADFEGEYPGKASFEASCTFFDGAIAIANAPGGIASASGKVSGTAALSGSLPGDVKYSGHIDLADASVGLLDIPGGIRSLSCTAKVAADFNGSSSSGFGYSGTAELLSGQVTAEDMPGGIRSLKGPVSGSLGFKGTYPGTPGFEGTVSFKDADLAMGEIPGVVRSLSGRVTGEIGFRAKDGNVETYSGKATVGPATFVSDGVYPGVSTARGPVRLYVEFSSAGAAGGVGAGGSAGGAARGAPGGEHLAYKGKATITGARLRGGRLFPGLVDIDGNVDSSFDFESTPEGVKYGGSAKVTSGKAVLGGEAVPGLERMEGDIVVSLDFQGVGGKTGTYSGKARLSGATLVAGEVATGVERIEGPASLDVAFSGGIGAGASYSGTVSVHDAAFRAAEIAPGMKSVTGRLSGDISFAGRPDKPVSYEGSADLTHASFAAGAVYPGIRELGGNGKAHLTFANTGASGMKGTAEITVSRGVLAHDAIGSRVEDIAAQVSVGENLIEIRGVTGRLGASKIEASGWLRPGKRVEIDLTLKSKDLALASLGKIEFAGEPAVLSGSAAVDLKLRGYYPGLQYGGRIALKGVTVKHPALDAPVRDISGVIALSGKKMTAESLKMTVAGLPAEVSGEITDPLDPRFDVTVSFADADIGRLVALFAPGASPRATPGTPTAGGDDGDGNRDAATGTNGTENVKDGSGTNEAKAANDARATNGAKDARATTDAKTSKDTRDANGASGASGASGADGADGANGVSGRGAITARLTGTTKELFVEGTADLRTLSFPIGGRAIAASRAKARFRYGEGALTLRQATAQVAGGEVAFEGVIVPGDGWPGAQRDAAAEALPSASPAVRITAELKGLSAAEVSPFLVPPDIAVSGTIDGNIVVAGGGPDGSAYSVAGSCRMAAGGVASDKADFAFTTLEASFRASDGRIAFDPLVVRGADGDIDARGTISLSQGGEVNLRAVVKGARLAKLARVAGYDGADGKLGFAGTISGKGSDLVIDGLADVEKGAIAGIGFDALTGRVRLSRSEVHLDSVSVRDGKASYLVSGKAGLDAAAGGSGLDLVVQIAGVPCRDVLSFAGAAGGLDLKGTLSGEVAVKGTAASPEAQGSVELSGGEMSGVKLDRADMEFAYAGGALRIARLAAKVGPADIAASGVVGKDGGLDLEASATGVDLAKLPVRIPDDLISAGAATFDGKVTGDLKTPRVEGWVSATNVVFRNVLLRGVAGTVKMDRKKIELSPLAIHDGSGDAVLTGTITPEANGTAKGAIELEMEAKGLGLRTAMDLVQPGYNADITGKVSGTVVLRGSMARPDVDIALQASGLSVAGVAFASAAIDARATAGDVELRVLRLRQEGGGYLEASGTSRHGGAISFMASARGFNAGVLASLLGAGYSVSGTLDLAAKIEGTSADPTATVAMQLTEGAVERVKFDTITARMGFRGGTITIEEGEIVQGRHRASVAGRLPLAGRQLAALGIAPPKRQEHLDIAISMKDASLVLLMMMSDQIEWAEGAMNVDLRIAGSLDAPQLRGHVMVSGGTVKLAPLADALKDMKGTVVFSGTEASIEGFSCRLGDGTVGASGKVAFVSGEGPRLDVRVKSERARVNTELLRALVDASLAVYGPAARPLISGDIKLAKAEVAPPSGLGSASVPFDADLALGVSTEGDLRVRTKIMDIPASGSLVVGGSLREPTLAGRVEAHRGWFAYFGNEFTVREAVAEFREDGGLMPHLDIQAETRAGDTAVYLALRGTPSGELTMDLTSSPPKGRDEILALLNYPGALAKILEGDVEGAMKEEIVRIFDQELRLQLVGGIERAFEDALSLDEFRFQRSTSNELTLRVGKYVVDDLYLSYEKGFGPQSSGVLRFDYMYGPGVVLTGKFDERGIYTFGIEARLRF